MKKLLIADDDKSMLGLLTTLLELEGYTVATETHPEKIISAVRREQPDLIILDIHVGGQETLKTLEQLKADAVLGEIPIIMISGMELRDQCTALGADGFVLKPFPPQELLNNIAPLLDKTEVSSS
ncbi:MAG: response regulator [Anaerolineae bacterium]